MTWLSRPQLPRFFHDWGLLHCSYFNTDTWNPLQFIPSDKALFECLGSVQHGWKEKNHVEAFQLMQPQRMMALVMHTCCSSLKQTDLCQHAR